MHADDVGKYIGPPCELCRTSQFVGTCTHRPRRDPTVTIVSEADLKKLADILAAPPVLTPAMEKLKGTALMDPLQFKLPLVPPGPVTKEFLETLIVQAVIHGGDLTELKIFLTAVAEHSGFKVDDINLYELCDQYLSRVDELKKVSQQTPAAGMTELLAQGKPVQVDVATFVGSPPACAHGPLVAWNEFAGKVQCKGCGTNFEPTGGKQ